MRLSYLSQSLIISAGFLIAIAAIWAVNGWQEQQLREGYFKFRTITAAVRNQTEADMMHDGLRGDVLYANKLLHDNNLAEQPEVRQAVAEHAENFRRLMRENAALPLPDNLQAILKDLEAPVTNYITAAEILVEQGLRNPTLLQQHYASFQEHFELLEDRMATASTAMMAEFTAIDKQMEAIKQQGRFYNNLSAFGGGMIAMIAFIAMFRAGRNQESLRRERRSTLNNMAQDFERSVGSVVQTVAKAVVQLRSDAEKLSHTTTASSEQTAAVATASDNTARNIHTVAAATEELSAAINEISMRINEASSVTIRAVDEAAMTSKTMASLAQTAQKIGDVVQFISEIAAQTNLLALNATIEAARAGEAGKGFAVVAAEVKNLANQTGTATEEISAQINAIQSETVQAVQAINSMNGTINNINDISASIAAAIEEQRAATQEIARNVQEAAGATNDVNNCIGNVTESITETGQSAQNLLLASQELSDKSGLLGSKVDQFISAVRQN